MKILEEIKTSELSFVNSKENQNEIVTPNITDMCGVIDLFCGIGGLTHGFIRESFNVLAGYDIDESCKYAYEINNNSKFITKDVCEINKEELNKLYSKSKIKILVGCAPCQPFSSYNFKNEDKKKWFLIHEFARLIEEVKPDIVSMENVPQLLNFKKANVFEDFISILEKNKYNVSSKIIDCPKYGLPQKRKRLVLLASKLSQITIIEETHDINSYVTVKDKISNLEPLNHGEESKTDPLHRASRLTPINLKRIRQSVPGGSWRDWDESLLLKCHLKESGKSYVSVYGRMLWNEPSPTITTQCFGLGNGRFGHPEQDRAITLREAALLQTFPQNYKFINPNIAFSTRTLGTHIGNAVPVELGQVIARSIKIHLTNHFKDEK